jgi:hypothetical protein
MEFEKRKTKSSIMTKLSKPLVICALIYLSVAFIALELNPLQWSQAQRYCFIIFTIISIFINHMITEDKH